MELIVRYFTCLCDNTVTLPRNRNYYYYYYYYYYVFRSPVFNK